MCPPYKKVFFTCGCTHPAHPSHSPDLLNAARPEEVYWLVKKNGYTHILRVSDQPELLNLYSEGEKLGYLWKENYFKGSNPY